MEKKLVVKICTGTLCYVTGGSELQMLDEHLSEELQEKIHVVGSPCLDHCNRCKNAKAPIVEVGEQVVYQATIEKVVDAINSYFNKK